MIGASNSTLPCSTSCMTAVATKGFVIDAMWNSVSAVTGWLESFDFITPKPRT